MALTIIKINIKTCIFILFILKKSLTKHHLCYIYAFGTWQDPYPAPSGAAVGVQTKPEHTIIYM